MNTLTVTAVKLKITGKIITPDCYMGICYYGVRSVFPLG